MNKINVNELKKGDILYKATDIGVIPNRIKDIDTESGYNAKIIFENGIVEELTKRTDSRSTGNKKPYFLTQEEADKYEIILIKIFNSIKEGYNLKEGGARGALSEESLLKKSNKAISDPQKLEDIELAYTLHTQEGLSFRQISKELGVSDKTIAKWVGQKETKVSATNV